MDDTSTSELGMQAVPEWDNANGEGREMRA